MSAQPELDAVPIRESASESRAADGGGDGAPVRILEGDARQIPIADASVDLVVTSPPYWRKRDYGVEGQIGQEATAKEYVAALLECLREWRRVLRPTGSVFLNIGDTFHKKTLAGVPGRIEAAAGDDGWIIRNRIIWAKDGGMPVPARNRLANRHEYVIHLALRHTYYYDLFSYAQEVANGANPGDVWQITPRRHMGEHLAPFPTEIARRAILLACPERVCPVFARSERTLDRQQHRHVRGDACRRYLGQIINRGPQASLGREAPIRHAAQSR